MIDVPERVKDALREGDRLKNYKFIIYDLVKGYVPAAKVSNNSSYDAIDAKPIKLVSEIDFTAVVSSFPSSTDIPATQGPDGQYYVEILNPIVADVIGVKDLPSDDDTVDLYHWTDEGEWLPSYEIDNSTLVSESVKFDERMCSGSELKFGLCEGTSLEFQYFDHESVTGKKIQAFVDVQYVDENHDVAWYTVPMGWYDVAQCPKQFSTGIYKVTAYNKLRSAYLDQNANIYLSEKFTGRSTVYFYELRKALTDEYEIDSSTVIKFDSVECLCGQVNGSSYSLVNPLSTTSPFYGTDTYKVSVASMKYSATLDPDKFYQFEWARGSVDDFEDSLYNTALTGLLTDAIGSSNTSAVLTSLIGTYSTGGYSGCYTLFGVVLTMRDGTTKIYSKRAHDNNKYGAVGPVSDISGLYWRDVTKIELYMPFALSLNTGEHIPTASNEQIYRTITIDGESRVVLVNASSISQDQNTLPGQPDDLVKYGHIDYDHAVDVSTHEPVIVPDDIPRWTMVKWGSSFTDGIFNIAFLWNYSLQHAYYGGLFWPYYFHFTFSDGSSTGSTKTLPAVPVVSDLKRGLQPAYGASPIDVNIPFRMSESEVVGSADLIQINIADLADITTREAVSSVYELSAYYGRLDRRTDFFAPIELNNSRLLPADDLYPADSLYPNGNSSRANRSMYQKLWTDSQGVQSFRYLIITYKTLIDGQEAETEMQKTINPNGTTDYYMSNNWILRNLVWTEQQVSDLADEMIARMSNVTWFPFEMWCAGLPYLETGDELEITTAEGTYTSYILQRQLNGIQDLQDTYIDGELDIF